MKDYVVDKEDWINTIYSIADGVDSLDAAVSGAYDYFKGLAGRHVPLDLPQLSKREQKEIYDWCREVEMEVEGNEL